MAFQQHKCICTKWQLLLIAFILLSILGILEAGNTKIAYKKPIYGKMDAINEKYLKLKQEHEKKAALESAKQKQQQQQQVLQSQSQATSTNNPLLISNGGSSTTTATAGLHEIPHIDAYHNSTTTAPVSRIITSTTTTATSTTTVMPTSTLSNLPAYCTCGIYLSSQIQHGQAQGAPVITYELDRVYPCNMIGQRQCQTKCLEKIVQHLPNAANILCATLDRDCRKERAYLFVKNCSHKWWNTSLAAGREYCCKSGVPYQCPLV